MCGNGWFNCPASRRESGWFLSWLIRRIPAAYPESIISPGTVFEPRVASLILAGGYMLAYE
jgi:hypothetical protein